MEDQSQIVLIHRLIQFASKDPKGKPKHGGQDSRKLMQVQRLLGCTGTAIHGIQTCVAQVLTKS